ncbi:MAG: hypothetical protein ACRD3O_15670, partial [Terriglobia bacterium]
SYPPSPCDSAMARAVSSVVPAGQRVFEPAGSRDQVSVEGAPWMQGNSGYRNVTMTKKREKMEMPVSTRVSASKFRTLEIWCDNSFRKRSEVLGMVIERVLDILEQQNSIEQPVEEFVRRLRASDTQ